MVMTVASSSSGLPGAGHLGGQLQAGQDAVAGGGVVGEDDVAGLLAAEAESRRRACPRARSGRPPRFRAA